MPSSDIMESFMDQGQSMAGRFQSFMNNETAQVPRSVNDTGLKPLAGGKDMTYDQALNASKDVFKNFYQQILKMIFTEIKRGEGDENNAYQSHMVGDLFVERLSEVLGQHETPDHHRMAESMMTAQAQKKAAAIDTHIFSKL